MFRSLFFRAVVAQFVLLLSVVNISHGQTLVAHDELWRYRKGITAPASDWKTVAESSLDSSWLSGRGGIGYADNSAETALCQTLLSDMRNLYSTVAMRRTFDVTNTLNPNLRLVLTADFDDAFIAYLDGAFLVSSNSPGSPAEPSFDAISPTLHESSRGDSTSAPIATFDLGPVGARLGIGTHVLSIVGLNAGKASSDLIQIFDLTLQEPPPPDCRGGIITTDTTWQLAQSPIYICSNVTVAAGATLTIDPGVVVQFSSNTGITLTNGGRLVAEGNETNRIRFTSPAGSFWRNIVIYGSTTSVLPETRIAFADFDSYSSTAINSLSGSLYLDHANLLSTNRAGVSLDESSFVVSHCYFAAGAASYEPAHGNFGIKPGGHGIFRRNFFAGAFGYNDLIDFTGGNRPNPIVHFINNVFSSGQDDGLDIDGTDAWVEGNIFLHIHRNNGTPDSAAAIAGGDYGSAVSHISIVGNIFYDCDNAVTAKQGNFFAVINNTIVHITNQGGVDIDSGAINVRDTTPSPTTWAAGVYAEGNIIFDAAKVVRNYDPNQTLVTLNNNILPIAWTGPGTNNIVADPRIHVPALAETQFTNWQSAQTMREWFQPVPNSPAILLGATLPLGVTISGLPANATTNHDFTITVGFNRTGSGITTNGWPQGMGYTHYKWRLDAGPWSAETPINTPIVLTSLSSGDHTIEITGKRDSGLYQDDPVLGEDASVTRATWTIQSGDIPEFTAIARNNNSVQLTFTPLPNQSYTLLTRESFDATQPWTKLQNIDPTPTPTPVTISDPISTTTRFYQLVSPALP